ncbi:MAG: phosphotransferase family protein [Candidatus Kariarchaeaceae archaeon]|jgi:aminoglycoside phosphotransferase (APT) family kinase protein
MSFITDLQKKELLLQLKPLYPESADLEIKNFYEIFGGADTRIISFDLTRKNQKRKETLGLILRLYIRDSGNERMIRDFSNLEKLFSQGLSVPKPYFCSPNLTEFSHAYMVMERIEGQTLDSLFQNADHRKQQEYLVKFIKEMALLHSLTIETLGFEAKLYDIKVDPYSPIKSYLNRFNQKISRYEELHELSPLIKWLEEKMVNFPSSRLVFIHGDFHPANIMVTPQGDFKILDWSSIRYEDFRFELGFSSVAIEAFGGEVGKTRHILSKIYTEETNHEVAGIEYFMLLSNFDNLFRFYSMLFNPKITNENPDTTDEIVKLFMPYVKYTLDLIYHQTGIKLYSIADRIKFSY